jgi:hypothetical protein
MEGGGLEFPLSKGALRRSAEEQILERIQAERIRVRVPLEGESLRSWAMLRAGRSRKEVGAPIEGESLRSEPRGGAHSRLSGIA